MKLSNSGHLSRVVFSAFLVGALAACAENAAFKNLGSTLLSQTGLMSASQADTLMSAGGEFVEAAKPLTPEQEHYLGRGVAGMVLAKYQPLRDVKVNAYVNKVGATVAAFSDRPETFGGYHFLVLDTDEVNALSAPGGFVFITKGLLDRMPSEDALAAVLAHEIGHIAKDHGVNAISQAHLTKGLSLLGQEAIASTGNDVTRQLGAAFGDSINDVFNTLVEKGYSRSQEYDADRYAAALLGSTGYNPHALVKMLEELHKHAGSGGWFATHPSPEDRIDEVKKKARPNPQAEKFEPLRTNRFKSAVHGGTSGKA